MELLFVSTLQLKYWLFYNPLSLSPRLWVLWQLRTACASCRRWWNCPASNRKSSCLPEPFRLSHIHSLAGWCWPPAQHSLAQTSPKVPQGWVGFCSIARLPDFTWALNCPHVCFFLREALTFPLVFQECTSGIFYYLNRRVHIDCGTVHPVILKHAHSQW